MKGLLRAMFESKPTLKNDIFHEMIFLYHLRSRLTGALRSARPRSEALAETDPDRAGLKDAFKGRARRGGGRVRDIGKAVGQVLREQRHVEMGRPCADPDVEHAIGPERTRLGRASRRERVCQSV